MAAEGAVPGRHHHAEVGQVVDVDVVAKAAFQLGNISSPCSGSIGSGRCSFRIF